MANYTLLDLVRAADHIIDYTVIGEVVEASRGLKEAWAHGGPPFGPLNIDINFICNHSEGLCTYFNREKIWLNKFINRVPIAPHRSLQGGTLNNLDPCLMALPWENGLIRAW